jgi:hypothetical protein
MRWTLPLDERDRMRDRFWLVLGVLLVAVIVSFASIGSRGVARRGVPASLAERVTELPNRLMEELADMTRNLAEAMGSTQSTPPVAAADAPASKTPDKQ